MCGSYKRLSHKCYKNLDIFELRLFSKCFHCRHCIMSVVCAKKEVPKTSKWSHNLRKEKALASCQKVGKWQVDRFSYVCYI